MRIENRAYTILESSTDSVFLHVTMNSAANKEWGTIFKSNSNGTYYGLSVEYVNRNSAGYVDFEKMIGLDGIAVINVVANPAEADISGKKKIQTRITHNDGGTWKPMTPPGKDSLGQEYDCSSTSCSLQIHGYTERRDPKATYSSPSAVGLMLAVGNVGEELAPYTDSDIFLTRDGGFTWEEVHKDAHMWEFGDSGSVIVLVNDEEPVDHVLFSTDEGLTWNEYAFGETLRVKRIQTVPQDTSRRFILLGNRPGEAGKSVLVHLDFSAITQQKCKCTRRRGDADPQVSWTSRIQITTTLSCGRPARVGMRRVCSVVRRCTIAGSARRTATSVRWSSSPNRLCATAHVQRRTLSGMSNRVTKRCHSLTRSANSTTTATSRADVFWSREPRPSLWILPRSSATDTRLPGTSVRRTARFPTRLAKEARGRTGASNTPAPA
jgi:hypothetical protein